jgi:integrase
MIPDVRLFKRDNGVYYVEVERGRWRSLKTRDKAQARFLFNQIRQQYLLGKVHQLTGRCTTSLGEYANKFLDWAEPPVTPKATWRANKLALDKLRAVAGDSTPLDRVSIRHLDEILADSKRRGLAVASINNYIRHARASLNKAVEWGLVKDNPLAKAKELPKERRPPVFLTQRDIARFLASITDPDVRRLAVAYLATGRRRSELLNLRWEDIDLHAGRHGRYLIHRAKNHLTRWYPINSIFRAVLEEIGPGRGRVFKRWTYPDSVSKVIKKALAAAGFGHMTLHSLRHTFASQQVMQGRALRTVQELLGHTEARTTEIYAHVAEDHLADEAEINLGLLSITSKAH